MLSPSSITHHSMDFFDVYIVNDYNSFVKGLL